MSSTASLTLTGFELLDTPIGGGDPSLLGSDSGSAWLSAVVPGGVHESLLAAGRIEHPFFGDNERASAWVEERDWWFRTSFARPAQEPGDRVRLLFQGLDTVADVWLNGVFLGHHENQFRPAEFDVTADLHDDNVLLVRFSPPLLGREVPPTVAEMMGRLATVFGAVAGEEPAEAGGMMATLPLATTVRKAAFSWGWDFGPNIPSIGIWRPVQLTVERGAVITGHHVALSRLSAARDRATAVVVVEAEALAELSLSAAVRLVSPAGREFTTTVPIRSGRGEAQVLIDDPELWWTHDLGTPALHDVTIELMHDGTVLDTVTDRIGLRTIVLDRGDDAGRRFRFVLNGMPLFARGASWLPASMFVGSVDADTYRDRVLRAREGNFTMLRVWGGGIYEHDAFYTVCDELGVLVWQDFMFACIDYPDADPVLRREVTLEAAYQVRRLRNRASLALWCGNNEVHIMHLAAYGNVDEGDWGWHFFHDILPAAVATHDGLTPYWPGSPYGEGGPFAINGTEDGDRHTWEVWHGLVIPGMTIGGTEFPTVGDARHYRRYADDTGRFVSEFGIHASPELATLRRWIPDEHLHVHSATFDRHNKDTPKNKGDELLAVTTGLPETLEEYVDYTQAVQAEGMAFGLEHYRRRQPETSGALMWQYNDVWPGFSWSVVDFDGVPKASYFAARRACAPVAVSFRDREDGGLELWLVNNGPSPVNLEIDVEFGAFDGSGRRGERVRAAAETASSVLVRSFAADRVPRDAAHYAWASSPVETFPAARKHFDEIGHLRFGASRLEVAVEGSSLRIRSIGYAYSVRIEQPVPAMRLSDNCFDLRDGDEVVISVTGADPRLLGVSTFPVRTLPA
ncbi:MAG TPA: hypothetical protein VGC18_15210 [Lacisediminihabitans sp.]|uniref:glycoside hydrolase family 2 protein n=1 Tax=Lacisediminihabitans sp. TaxID=2787631 RepID=UPI002ED8FEE9